MRRYIENKDFIPKQFIQNNDKRINSDIKKMIILLSIVNLVFIPRTLFIFAKNNNSNNDYIIENKKHLYKEDKLIEGRTIIGIIESISLQEIHRARIDNGGGNIEVEEVSIFYNNDISKRYKVTSVRQKNSIYEIGVRDIEK